VTQLRASNPQARQRLSYFSHKTSGAEDYSQKINAFSDSNKGKGEIAMSKTTHPHHHAPIFKITQVVPR
jgi:hypothetical protein